MKKCMFWSNLPGILAFIPCPPISRFASCMIIPLRTAKKNLAKSSFPMPLYQLHQLPLSLMLLLSTVGQLAKHLLMNLNLQSVLLTQQETQSELPYLQDTQPLLIQSARWVGPTIKSSKLLYGQIKEVLNANWLTKLSLRTKCWKSLASTIQTMLEFLEIPPMGSKYKF